MAEMTVLDVVRGISQAIANSHDGALVEEGNPIEIGLKREEEVSRNGNILSYNLRENIKI